MLAGGVWLGLEAASSIRKRGYRAAGAASRAEPSPCLLRRWGTVRLKLCVSSLWTLYPLWLPSCLLAKEERTWGLHAPAQLGRASRMGWDEEAESRGAAPDVVRVLGAVPAAFAICGSRALGGSRESRGA